VRKTAGYSQQNGKLLQELQKLTRLAEIAQETGLFVVPEIHQSGVTDEDLVFYELEFVPGWELDTFISRAVPQRIEEIVSQLFDIIGVFAELPAGGAGDRFAQEELGSERDFLIEKLKESRVALQRLGMRFPETIPLITEYCDLLPEINYDLHQFMRPQTFCHGDLALDNVLIDRHGSLVLIDPLINGHESFMWDVSKVFQSTLARWEAIKHNDFEVDLQRRKILLPSSERISLFNLRFAELVSRTVTPCSVIIYLATTLARAAKYSSNSNQLSALLLMMNELLSKFIERSCTLDEPLSSLRR